MLDIYISED